MLLIASLTIRWRPIDWKLLPRSVFSSYSKVATRKALEATTYRSIQFGKAAAGEAVRQGASDAQPLEIKRKTEFKVKLKRFLRFTRLASICGGEKCDGFYMKR